ncbi:unnamed protein product [Auanema sp. JU1783]|nr:unnamed protein product [Auanema sp. JU1783]
MCRKKKKKEDFSKTVSDTQKSLTSSRNNLNSKNNSQNGLKENVCTEVQPNQEKAILVMNYRDELAITEKKEVNYLEKAAARRGVILNPENVFFCGNLDDIAIAKKNQIIKEIDEMAEKKSFNVRKDFTNKQAFINEKACKLYEIHDDPTVEEVDSFSDLY